MNTVHIVTYQPDMSLVMGRVSKVIRVFWILKNSFNLTMDFFKDEFPLRTLYLTEMVP